MRAESAAIRVVSDLRDTEIEPRKANVVYRLKRRIPAVPIRIAIADREPELVLRSRDDRVRPDLVVVSTVNGHGFHDGMRLIGRLRACEDLAATPAVIGGKLGIAGAAGRESRDQLVAAGFDAVFDDGTGLAAFRAFTERLMTRVTA